MPAERLPSGESHSNDVSHNRRWCPQQVLILYSPTSWLGRLAGLLLATIVAAAPDTVDARDHTAQTYSPRGTPMTFTLVHGTGPQGAKSWVAASGTIQADTPKEFTAFKAASKIDGLFLVLDSNGGSVAGGMALGEMVRAARMQTTVGRTLMVGTTQAVRSTDVSCASSCVLVLMAGTTRVVPQDARVEVHMFSVSLNSAGDKLRPDITMQDVENAQRGMARHAVYVTKMGVDVRYLELMTQATFKGPVRRLTVKELTDVKLATTVGQFNMSGEDTPWMLTPDSATAQLLRTMRLLKTEKQTVDHEIVLACDQVKGFYMVTYRQILTQVTQPIETLWLTRARLETGGWDFIFRAPARGLSASAAGSDVWMRRSVPAKVLDDAIANRRLEMEVTTLTSKREPFNFFDPGLAKLLPQLAKRCNDRPGQVTVGPHPVH